MELVRESLQLARACTWCGPTHREGGGLNVVPSHDAERSHRDDLVQCYHDVVPLGSWKKRRTVAISTHVEHTTSKNVAILYSFSWRKSGWLHAACRRASPLRATLPGSTPPSAAAANTHPPRLHPGHDSSTKICA